MTIEERENVYFHIANIRCQMNLQQALIDNIDMYEVVDEYHKKAKQKYVNTLTLLREIEKTFEELLEVTHETL